MGGNGPLTMHILYIQQILNLPEKSGNCRTYEMARYYVQSGHQVTLLTSATIFHASSPSERPSSFPYRFERDGIQIYVVKGSYSHFLTFYQRIWAFICFFFRAYQTGKTLTGVDRIIAYSPPLTTTALGQKLARFHRVPLVLEIADVWPDVPIGMRIFRNPMIIGLLRHLAKKIYTQAQLLLPYSEDMKEQLLSYPVDSRNIRVIHNGVNVRPEISKVPQDKQASDAEVVHIIYTGTVGQANGIDQLVDAIDRLSPYDLPPFRLQIVGDGNRIEEVKAQARVKEVKTIQFLPWVPRKQLPHWLGQADIAVSSFAPFPILEANGATKFFDYLANGLPIVLNYQGWQAQYLAQYTCGLSSDQGDIEGFCKNLVMLIKHPEVRKEMGENGKRLAKTQFDRRMLAQKSIEYIASIPPL